MLFKAAKFTVAFVLLLSIIYFIQTNVFLMDPEITQLVNFSYLFNFGFTYFFLINFLLFKEKLIEYAGFIFLVISTVKLGMFIYLIKTSNYDLDKTVFFHFFIPFLVCVGVEIYYLIQELNKANFNNSN